MRRNCSPCNYVVSGQTFQASRIRTVNPWAPSQSLLIQEFCGTLKNPHCRRDLVPGMGPQSVNAGQIRFLGHCLRRPQGDLISKYALYHPTHGKPIPGRRKNLILFHEYAARLINSEISSPLPNEIHTLAQGRKAFGSQGLSKLQCIVTENVLI